MCKYIYIRYNMIILGKKGLCQGGTVREGTAKEKTSTDTKVTAQQTALTGIKQMMMKEAERSSKVNSKASQSN